MSRARLRLLCISWRSALVRCTISLNNVPKTRCDAAVHSGEHGWMFAAWIVLLHLFLFGVRVSKSSMSAHIWQPSEHYCLTDGVFWWLLRYYCICYILFYSCDNVFLFWLRLQSPFCYTNPLFSSSVGDGVDGGGGGADDLLSFSTSFDVVCSFSSVIFR